MAGADGTIIVSSVMQDAGFVSTVNRFIGSLSSFGAKLTATQAALAVFGLAFAAVVIPNIIKATREFREYEKQVANLSKVLNSVDLGAGIAAQIGNLSTQLAVSREELLRVAETAARLGIRGGDNIREFTRVMGMMGVATDLSADEAADALARIALQTRTPIENIEELAGVINALGNTMATSDREIVNAMRRSAPALAQLGLTAGEIAALGASLNEVSESSDRAGTRLSRFAQELSRPNKVEMFAKAVGMTTTAFEELLEADPRAAILEIIDTFEAGGRGADILATNLDANVLRAMSALAQNSKNLRQAFKTMTTEMGMEITSIREEYAVFGSTLEAVEIQSENVRKELRKDLLGGFGEGLRDFKTSLLDLLVWMDRVRVFREDRVRIKLEDMVPSPIAIDEYRESVRDLDTALFKLAKRSPDLGNIKTLMGARPDFRGIGREIDEILLEAIENAGDFRIEMTSMASAVVKAVEELANADRTSDLKGFAGRLSVTMGDIQSTFDGLNNTAQESGPIFDQWVESLRMRVRELLAEGKLEQVQLLLIGASQAAAALGIAFRHVVPEVEDAGGEVEDLTDKVKALIERLREQRNELAFGELGALKLTAIWKAANAEQRKVIETLFEQIESWEQVGEARQKYEEIEEKAAQAARQRRAEEREAREETRRRIADLGEEIAAIRSMNPDAMTRLNRQRELNAAMEEMTELGVPEELKAQRIQMMMNKFAAEDWVEAQMKLNEANKSFKQLLAENRDMFVQTQAEAYFDILTDSIQEMGKAAGTVFDAMIGKTGNLGDALVEMIQRVARTVFEKQITQLLFSALASGLPSTFTVGAGPGSRTPLTSDRPNSSPIGGGPTLGDRTTPPNFDVVGVGGTANAVASGTTVIENHYHYDIRALDGASVREILVRERDTVAGITMNTISRSRTMKKSGVM